MAKKKKTSDSVQELERRLSKALRDRNDKAVCDVYIELGEQYRHEGNLQASLCYYHKGAQASHAIAAHENAAFAHRAIAEISVDPSIGENKSAVLHGMRYLEAAQATKQVHLIQLAYHVLGWLYLQVYLNSEGRDEKLLAEAKRWCEKSLAYLHKNAQSIDCDKDAVRIGQDSGLRKARLRQVLSQICDKMNMTSQALRHHNAAMAYASRVGNHDLRYRCLLSKLNFSGDQRLKTAIELVHVASNLGRKEHVEAKYILAQEKIRAKDFEGAKWDFISLLASGDSGLLEDDERGTFQQTLIVVYKIVERLKLVPGVDQYKQMRLYERIADELFEIDFRETSLDFYKDMLSSARAPEDKLKALVSLAVTANDLEYYDEAYRLFLKVEEEEKKMKLTETKRAETAICIANTATKVKSLSNGTIMELFQRAEEMAVTLRQKNDVLESLTEFLESSGAATEALDEAQSKLRLIRDEIEKEGYGEEEEGKDEDDKLCDWNDEWSSLNDSEVLGKCRAEANRRCAEERIKFERDKRINSYGETRMHEAARGNDTAYLKTLIKAGYSLNARDEGGWTPLHEAIGALKLDNVRILLEAGARLDIRSNEGTLSAEGERTDSGGLTPLMEACDRGATAIVQLLLRFGANVTMKNKDGWTALDFFRNAVKAGMVEEEDMSDANRLITQMEEKLRQANVAVNVTPPPKKLLDKTASRQASGKKESVSNVQKLSNDERNLREYIKMIRTVGRGDAHQHFDPLIDEQFAGPEEDPEDGLASAMELDDELDNIFDENGDGGIEVHSVAPSTSKTVERQWSSEQPAVCLGKRKRRAADEFFGIPKHSFRSTDDLRDFIVDDGEVENLPTVACPGQLSSPERTNFSKRKARLSFNESIGSGSEEERVVQLDNFLKTSNSSDSFAESRQILTLSNESPRGSRLSSLAVTPPNSSLPATTGVTSRSASRSTTPSSSVSLPTSSASEARLILLKINFLKNDGTRLKTKGIPFKNSCTVDDVRKRCMDEVTDVGGGFDSISICQGDCELSVDTPIELVVTDLNNSLDCVLSNRSSPAASQVYLKKSKKPLMNVVRAFNDSSNGILDLSDANIGDDVVGVCASFRALLPDRISELRLSGNNLHPQILELTAIMARNLTSLELEGCSLTSKNVKILMGDGSTCRLVSLNLSYNDIGSEADSKFLPSFLRLCPNLRSLRLSSCNLCSAVIAGIIQEAQGLATLEALDLSNNRRLLSDKVTELLNGFLNLKNLNLANTGLRELRSGPNTCRLLERVNFSHCGLFAEGGGFCEWLVVHCECLSFIDLSITKITIAHLETIIKWKTSKPPILTVKLSGCSILEAAPKEFVNLLESHMLPDTALLFQLNWSFRKRVSSQLSSSLSFCIKS